MFRLRNFSLVALLLALSLLAGCAAPAPKAPPKELLLSTTTSTQDSGLLDVLLPAFEKKYNYKVKTIAVGTGQALAMGAKGEADVLLVHAPQAEKELLKSGAATDRQLVMHNDFLLVGPKEDAAAVAGRSLLPALEAIAAAQAPFISRGDDSGTHKLEKALWKDLKQTPQGGWYIEAGAGMGQTLKIASERRGYTLTDRATFLAQQKNLSLQPLVEGDPRLLNLYHVMRVNTERFPKVNGEGATAFRDFLLSAEGQGLIAAFGKDRFGQALFTADGGKSEEAFTK